MNDTTLKNNIRALLKPDSIDPDKLDSAIRSAMFAIAQLFDLPTLNGSLALTGVSGTASYSLTGYSIDRVTSIMYGTFNLSNNQIPIAEYNANYYSTTTPQQGSPFTFCIHNKVLKIYYVPDTSSTINITYQRPISKVDDIDDKYSHIMNELVFSNIYKKGSAEWLAGHKQITLYVEAITSPFKLRRNRKEATLEQRLRMRDLNEL